MSTALKWKIFVTPGVPTVNDDFAPGETVRMWSPTSSILLYGERDAILADTLTTTAQANALADWVEKAGKNLTTIYATHGHGDHFFGNGILLKRFPGAKAVATPKVLEIMKKQTSPQVMAGLWNKRFPGLIPENIVLPDEMKGNSLHLEGHELNVVDVGHTDTDDCTCLHVPSADLVVAGDIAYNDVHQYFAESLTHEKRMDWIGVPVSCAIIVLVTFTLFVEGGIERNPLASLAVFAGWVGLSLIAIHAENKKRFISPLRRLELVLNDLKRF